MDKFWEKNKKECIFAGICLGLFLAVKYLLGFVLPFLIALLLTLCIGPPVNLIHEKTHISKWLLTIFFLTVLSAALLFLFSLLGYGFWGRLMLIWKEQDSYLGVVTEKMAEYCCFIEQGLHLKRDYLVNSLQNAMADFQAGLAKTVQTRLVPGLFSGSLGCIRAIARVAGFLLVMVFATILMVKDFDKWGRFIRERRSFRLLREIGSFLKVYVLAQVKILTAIAALCLLGFILTKTKGAIGLALLTACLDVLPFIGTGIILVPMVLWKLLMADYVKAALLAATYISCIILREYMEPKLISRETGISPLLTLAGIYIGMKVFGLGGIVLGPLYILLVTLVFREIFSNS